MDPLCASRVCLSTAANATDVSLRGISLWLLLRTGRAHASASHSPRGGGGVGTGPLCLRLCTAPGPGPVPCPCPARRPGTAAGLREEGPTEAIAPAPAVRTPVRTPPLRGPALPLRRPERCCCLVGATHAWGRPAIRPKLLHPPATLPATPRPPFNLRRLWKDFVCSNAGAGVGGMPRGSSSTCEWRDDCPALADQQ